MTNKTKDNLIIKMNDEIRVLKIKHGKMIERFCVDINELNKFWEVVAAQRGTCAFDGVDSTNLRKAVTGLKKTIDQYAKDADGFELISDGYDGSSSYWRTE